MTLETRSATHGDRHWFPEQVLLNPNKSNVSSSSSRSLVNDDDSSVAMELFLRNRMDAVFSQDDDDEDDERVSRAAVEFVFEEVDEEGEDRGPTFDDYSGNEKHSVNRELPKNQSATTLTSSKMGTITQLDQSRNPDQRTSSSSESADSSSSSDGAMHSAVTAATVPSTPVTLNTNILLPELADSPTLALVGAASSVDGSCSPPPVIYNPVTSYSPRRRREVTAFSLIRWKSTSDLRPRRDKAEVLDLSPSLTSTTDDEDGKDCDHGDDEDDNSEHALERWARRIRIELRHAEIAQLAVEAERAAEAGLESFAAKLSTYGNNDSLLSPASSGAGSVQRRTTTSKPRLKRRKSFSEGTKVPVGSPLRSLRHRQKVPVPLGVMELRDVNEVFPSFSQFHDHLRTHFARCRVDQETLVFSESGLRGSSTIRHHSMLPSDLFTAHWGVRDKTSPAEGILGRTTSHSRSPSDFLKNKHKKSPSDFFQSLSFDRWIKPASSSSDHAVEVTGSADVLADHLAVDGQSRQMPQIVVPPGLEMPSLDPRLPEACRAQVSVSSPGNARYAIKMSHSELARALFDDEEPESDGESAGGELAAEVRVSKNPPDFRMRSYNRVRGLPERRSGISSRSFDSSPTPVAPPPPPHPEHTDYMTPAKLRVIRNSASALMPQGVISTPNSVIDANDVTIQTSSPNQHDYQVVPSILMPGPLEPFEESWSLRQAQHSSRVQCPINFSLQPKSSFSAPRRSSSFAASAPSFSSVIPITPPATSFDEIIAMRSDETDIVAELEAAVPASPVPPQERNDLGETDCYEIGRILTPDCECEHAGDDHFANGGQQALTSDSTCRRRNVTVKIYRSSSRGERDDANSANNSILQHSQTIEFVEPLEEKGPDSDHSAVCSCLALSPVSSHGSRCPTPVQEPAESPVVEKPSLMRRSSSANALASLEQTPQGLKWNPFGGNKSTVNSEGESTASSGTGTFHRTAVNLFTRMSSRRKNLYLPTRVNDDFLHNYLYCSKSERVEMQSKQLGVSLQGMCENVSSELCFCASFFPDSSLNTFLNNRRQATSAPLLSLSRDNNPDGSHRAEADPWFDLNHFEFLEPLSGRPACPLPGSPWKISFQAPALRKGESCRKMRTDSLVVEDAKDVEHHANDIDEYVGIEEKKSDEKVVSRSPKHSRHLSYFPSRQGPQFTLSDNQFENIYGVAPETLADALTRDAGVFSLHLQQEEADVRSVRNTEKDLVEFDVMSFHDECSRKDDMQKETGHRPVTTATSF